MLIGLLLLTYALGKCLFLIIRAGFISAGLPFKQANVVAVMMTVLVIWILGKKGGLFDYLF